MTAVCAFERLTKFYGPHLGVQDITFEVMPGEVYGFLGANGAGKTTAMRVLMGLLRPTSGRALLFGEDATEQGHRLRARVGYLPGALSLYGGQTGRDYLRFMAGMRGVDCTREIDVLCQRLSLDPARRIRELSKGNRQKVGLIAAFMHRPDLLVLDEATGGLDPLVQREFEAMLGEVRARGGALLFSSHVLSEVEHQADKVAVLHEGRLLTAAPLAELRRHARHTIEFEFPHVPDVAALRGTPGVLGVTVHERSATCVVRGDEHALLAEAVRQGVTAMRTHEQSLEDVFFELIAGGAGDADAAA